MTTEWAAGMLIRISIERTQPLAGTAEREDAAPVAFDGWLELLRAISELACPPPPGDEGADEGRLSD
jgi:hypothetical protein